MTSPISISLEEDSMKMMFMVPKKYNKSSLPKPNQSQIRFVDEPEKRMAAIRFEGWESNEQMEQNKKRLTTGLENEGINYKSKFYFFGYNPPFEILNRRNEIVGFSS